jgi:hypothetical protein
MEKVLEVGKWLLANWDVLIASIIGLFSASLALAMIIPGNQPDKFLQGALDFLLKFSRKPVKQEEPEKK